MMNEPGGARFSARSGFFFGVAAAAIIGGLVFMATRNNGARQSANAPMATPSMAMNAPAVSQTTENGTLSAADHVAAMSNMPAQMANGAAPMASSPNQTLLSGTIQLDPSIAQSVSGTMTVFVIARDKNGKGHPVLARRLDVASFPVKFSLGSEDSMMGQTAPGNVSLEARIDLDHDAMTREAGAPAAKIESVAIGSRNLVLTLKRGA